MITPKAYASGIPVWYSHSAIAPIEKCVPNPANPNEHPVRQIELLAKIIKAQGWRNPIVISTRSGFIVKGHARLMAAQHDLLNVAEVPIDYQDYESEAMEYADLAADNRIAELAYRDLEKLGDLLKDIDLPDIELTGYSRLDLDSMFVNLDFGAPPNLDESDSPRSKEKPADPPIYFCCPKCGANLLMSSDKEVSERS